MNSVVLDWCTQMLNARNRSPVTVTIADAMSNRMQKVFRSPHGGVRGYRNRDAACRRIRQR